MSKKSQPARESERRAHIRTKLIHGASQSRHWDYAHHVVPPISSSATFRLDSAERAAQGFLDFAHDSADLHDPIYIYDRLDEPTRGMLEENLAIAEGGELAVSYSSGMAAIAAVMTSLLKAGDRLIAHHLLYGCTYSLLTNWLPRFGIQVCFVDLNDRNALLRSVDDKTRLFYFETPVNPDMTLIDISAVCDAAAEFNIRRSAAERIWVAVDNTFATPFCQRPIQHGADIVCHSLTKGIGGFGTDVGGAVIAPHAIGNTLLMNRKDFGGILSPKAAWATLVYGLPSLATRMNNYQKTAHHVARHLARHPRVEKVVYPGLESFPQFELAKRQMCDPKGHFAPGSMLYFVLRGSREDPSVGTRFVDYVARNSYAVSLAVSLGQIKTLIECPFSMTHSALPTDVRQCRGVVPGGIRLSCGLEDWEDIVSDLVDALETL